MPPNLEENRSEHIIVKLNIARGSLEDVIAKFGHPASRNEAPKFGPDEPALSHSEWIFDRSLYSLPVGELPRTMSRNGFLE